MKHGTTNTYRRWGCRCDLCVQGMRDYWRKCRAPQRAARPAPPEPDDVAVDRACRGDRTVALNRWEMAEALARLHDQRPRRSLNNIAAVLGVTQRTVVRWRTGRTTLPHARPAQQPRTPGEQAC